MNDQTDQLIDEPIPATSPYINPETGMEERRSPEPLVEPGVIASTQPPRPRVTVRYSEEGAVSAPEVMDSTGAGEEVIP